MGVGVRGRHVQGAAVLGKDGGGGAGKHSALEDHLIQRGQEILICKLDRGFLPV